MLFDHLVDQAVRLRFFRGHEEVPVRIFLDFAHLLAGVLDQDLVQLPAQVDDLLGLDLEIRGLAPHPAEGLMDHDP